MSLKFARGGWLLATYSFIVLTAAACAGGAAPSSTPQPGVKGATPQAPAQTSTGATTGSQQFDGTILIGASTSLTGSLAKEGGLTLNGSKLAVDEYNKAGGVTAGGKHYKLELKIYDDESKSDTTVKLIDKLVNEDHVQFLLSPYSSGQVQAGAPISEKYKKLMMNTGGAADSIFTRGFKYLFTTETLASRYLYSTIDMAMAQQNPAVKKVALIGANDVFSVTVMDAAEKYATSKGLQVVYKATYPPASKDISTILTAAKAQQPDALLGSGHFEDAILTVRQAKQLDVNVKMMAFTVGPSTPDFPQSLGKDADYVLGPVSWSPQQKTDSKDIFKSAQNFASLYKAQFGDEADYHAAQGAAGVVALVEGIKAADSIDTEKVRDALSKLDVQSFWGQIKFNEGGVTAAHEDVVEQIQNGSHVLVWPTDIAAGKQEYPIPSWSQR